MLPTLPHQKASEKTQPKLAPMASGGNITFVNDGGWDHQPRSSEPRLGLTLEHLCNKRMFSCIAIRAAGMSSYNEAERLNGLETRAVQKAILQDAVLLEEDQALTPADALQTRRRRFQNILAYAISGGKYAGEHITSVVSHPDIPLSNTFMAEFRSYCRVVLDGHTADVPCPARPLAAPRNAKSYSCGADTLLPCKPCFRVNRGVRHCCKAGHHRRLAGFQVLASTKHLGTPSPGRLGRAAPAPPHPAPGATQDLAAAASQAR